MIETLGEALAAKVVEYQAQVDGRDVISNFAWYDDTEPKPNEVLATVYPMAKRKTRLAEEIKNRSLVYYVAIRAQCKPKQTSKIQTFANYVDGLDTYFELKENRRVAGANYQLTDDDQFFWFPERLAKSRFVALLELRYQSNERMGAN